MRSWCLMLELLKLSMPRCGLRAGLSQCFRWQNTFRSQLEACFSPLKMWSPRAREVGEEHSTAWGDSAQECGWSQWANCHWFYWTIGSRCDDCAAGFFGNPSEVGGMCQLCHCHHNIDTTDPEACDKETGRCLKCLYHTEGEHCQLCRYGYYGDALQQDCRSKMHVHFAYSLEWFPLPSMLGDLILEFISFWEYTCSKR